MQKIYEAANLPEAYLILHMLDEAGIPARVFNENAQGAVGELPFIHTYPEIWVFRGDDITRACEVLNQFEQGAADPGLVLCSHCAEENPANFELCWRCGKHL